MQKENKKLLQIMRIFFPSGEIHTSNTYSEELCEYLCRKCYPTVTDPEGIHFAPSKTLAGAQMTKGRKNNRSHGNNTYLVCYGKYRGD